jgi:hypothetical protein
MDSTKKNNILIITLLLILTYDVFNEVFNDEVDFVRKRDHRITSRTFDFINNLGNLFNNIKETRQDEATREIIHCC